jgi:hypothetical protein
MMDEPCRFPFPSEQDVPWSAGPTVQNVGLQDLPPFLPRGRSQMAKA